MRRRSCRGVSMGSDRAQEELNGIGVALPGADFAGELFASGGGEGVELGAAVVLGRAPLGVEQAAILEAVQRGVEGALVDLEDAARDLLDALADPPAVHGL